MLWTSRESSYISTPTFFQDHLYWISDKNMATCLRASDGELIRKRKVPLGQTGERVFVASPVLVGKHLLSVSRRQGAFVFEAVPGLPLLGIHQFASDRSDFNATPGISDGKLFLRSNKYLYCVDCGGD